MRKFFLSIILCILCPLCGRAYTLVIDAGHGGKDTGAMGAFSKEKDINLAIALAFGKYVEMNCPDVKVIYTRKTDVFIELNERANIANRNKADLFISVHTNALPKGRIARGFETYTLGMHRAADNLAVAQRENSVITMESDYRTKYEDFDPNSAESYIMFEYMQDKNMENSVKLAKHIQKSVCASASRQDKGVYQAGFLVLRKTSMPSCLIELGFISTPDEEQQLNDPIVRNQIAKGIYEAFMNYRGQSPVYNWTPEPVTRDSVKEVREIKESKESRESKESKEGKIAKEVKVAKETKDVKEKKEVKESKEIKKDNSTSLEGKIVYKVQLVSLKNKIKTDDSRFKGLENIECYEDGGLYKYTCGATTNIKEARELQNKLRDRFPEAFIIKTKDGKRI